MNLVLQENESGSKNVSCYSENRSDSSCLGYQHLTTTPSLLVLDDCVHRMWD